VLHLISSAVLGLGGLYHALRGPEILKNIPPSSPRIGAIRTR